MKLYKYNQVSCTSSYSLYKKKKCYTLVSNAILFVLLNFDFLFHNIINKIFNQQLKCNPIPIAVNHLRKLETFFTEYFVKKL